MLYLVLPALLTWAGTAYCTFIATVLSELSHAFLSGREAEGDAAAQKLHQWKHAPELPYTALGISTLALIVLGSASAGIWAADRFDGLHGGLLAALAYLLALVPVLALARAVGARYAKNMYRLCAHSLTGLILLSGPIAYPAAALLRFLLPRETADEESAREDIDEILETAHEEGSLDADEYRLLKSIMRFSDVLVSDVMTPRTVVFGCSADNTVREVLAIREFRHYSRFPIWENDSPDSVIGYVLGKDVLWAMINKRPDQKLRDISRDVYFIPENVSLDRALENFLERRDHLFVAVDEYGGVEGLITMEDVLETILGVEIMDEADNVPDLRHLAKQRRDLRISARQDKADPSV